MSFALAAFAPMAGADTVTYVGPSAVSSGCAALAKPPNGASSETCHQVPAGAATASIEIMDAVFGAKGGFYAFDSRAGVNFCGAVDAPVPANAKWLRVGTSLADACSPTPTAGTTGSVTVEWS